jgi:hypothetical protein
MLQYLEVVKVLVLVLWGYYLSFYAFNVRYNYNCYGFEVSALVGGAKNGKNPLVKRRHIRHPAVVRDAPLHVRGVVRSVAVELGQKKFREGGEAGRRSGSYAFC